MREDLDKYYIPRTFLKKEMRYNFFMGFIIGAVSVAVSGIIIALLLF